MMPFEGESAPDGQKASGFIWGKSWENLFHMKARACGGATGPTRGEIREGV